MGFQISDCRFVRPGSRTGCLSSAEGDDEPLTSGAKALWILERLRGPKGPLFHGAGTCRTVRDVSHGAAHGAGRVARCWTTERRALYLAALTARLKPCPSTTVPIPAFLRNLLSRAFPKDIYEVLFPCGLCACGLFTRQGV